MPIKFSLSTSCLLVLALTGYVAAYVSGSSLNYLADTSHTRHVTNDEQEASVVNTSSEPESVQAKDPLPFPVAGLPLPPGYSIPSVSGLAPTTNFAAGNGLPNFQLPGFPYFPQGIGVVPGSNYPGVYPTQGQGFPPPGQGFPQPGQGLPPPGQGFPPPGQGFPLPGQGFNGFPVPGPESGFPTPINGVFLPSPLPGQGFPIPSQGGLPGQGFPIPAQGGFPGQGFPIPAQGGSPGEAFASSGGGQAFATSSSGNAGGAQGPGFLATTIPGQGFPTNGEGFPNAQGFPTPAGFPGQTYPQGLPLPPPNGYFPGQFDTTVASDEPDEDTPASASISFDEQPHETVYGAKGGYVYEKP